MIDKKLDRLLEDLTIVKTKLDNHAADLAELKDRLEPVFYHVNGVKWVLKLGAGVLGVISCLAAVMMLMK